MPASTPNPEAGRQLKEVRLRVQLSTREVEQLSQKLAQEKRNQEYYISHGWLTEVENGVYTPSVYKLYSLSIIYKRGLDEILAFFGIHLSDIGREQMWLTLPHTHLIGDQSQGGAPAIEIPAHIRSKLQLERTNLVSQMFNHWGGVPASLLPHMDLRNCVYGYVGMNDFTLFPIIRPGSFLQIDASQTRVDRSGWSNEFDRPVYFIELRDSYACTWCELKEGRLLLIPYPQPRSHIREVLFPSDAGIVGRVTAVSMPIAEPR